MMQNKKRANKPYHRIVIKLGTSLLTGGSDHLSREVMAELVAQVATLHQESREVILVSSGAVASGRHKLGITKKKRGTPFKQVLASVGQSRLMSIYEELFEAHGITVAQALLTHHDLSDRAGYLNARNTLLSLMELDVITIVNENDVVATDEIHETRFGDNDNLSAMVANLVDADLLMILSDIDGLYTADPHHNPSAELIPEVREISTDIEKLAHGTSSKSGIGGMVTKIEAARKATRCGVTVLIAKGSEPSIIIKLANGDSLGSRFLPQTSKLESRQRWLLSGLANKGRLIVDKGAADALSEKQRSLLASGIKQASGKFTRGDIVDIYDTEGKRLGSGITNYSASDIEQIKGKHSRQIVSLLGYDYGSEIIHRNNLVLI